MIDQPKPTGEWTVARASSLLKATDGVDGLVYEINAALAAKGKEGAYVAMEFELEHAKEEIQLRTQMIQQFRSQLAAIQAAIAEIKRTGKRWRKDGTDILENPTAAVTKSLVEFLNHLIHSDHGFSPDSCHGCAQSQRLANAKEGK